MNNLHQFSMAEKIIREFPVSVNRAILEFDELNIFEATDFMNNEIKWSCYDLIT